MLLSVIVYVYTVIAFNFFRKFYNKGEDGEDDYKCHDMLTVRAKKLYMIYQESKGGTRVP